MSEWISKDHQFRPGDRARILCRDGELRPATLGSGFIWVTDDGEHHIAAEGGFGWLPIAEARP